MNLKNKNIHFIGIGGSGMSGLARITKAFGASCTGSDMNPGIFTETVEADDIPVQFAQQADNIPEKCDFVVISAAVREENPELSEARKRNIPVLKYAEMVGKLMLERTGIAIAGTHGKSTTTAILAHILLSADLNPTFILGARCKQIGGGSQAGRPDQLIAEACEFDRSFHNYHQTHSVILNVDEDHLDVYGSLENIIEAFHKFAKQTPEHGSLLIAHEGAHRNIITSDLLCSVETVGFDPEATWVIEPTKQELDKALITPSARIYHKDEIFCEFTIQIPGTHMIMNAAVAAITARKLGASAEQISNAIGSFEGLQRRMEVVGTVNNITVIDDYGHHPTEIDTTLKALKSFYKPETKNAQLICVFQPHQHQRTRFLLSEFSKAFEAADAVLVPHIYQVRDTEEDKQSVSAKDLVEKLQENGIAAKHIDAFEDIVKELMDTAKPDDLVVVMGAGPVGQIAHRFVEARSHTAS